MKTAYAAVGAKLLLMIIGTSAFAAAATAAVVGILWIGAVYSWIALIPILFILLAVNEGVAKKVAQKRREAESRNQGAGDPHPESTAIAMGILTLLAMGGLGYATYEMAQVFGWWPIAIIAIASVGLSKMTGPVLPHEAAERDRETAAIREAMSRRILTGAARYRSERPDATSRG